MAITRRAFGKLLGAVGAALGTGFVPLDVLARPSVLESLLPFVGTYEFRRLIPRENSIYGAVSNDGSEIWKTIEGRDPESGIRTPGTRETTTLAKMLAGTFKTSPDGTFAVVIVGPGLAGHAKNVRTKGVQVVVEKSQPDRDAFVIAGLNKPIKALEDLDPRCLARVTLGHHGPFIGATRDDYPTGWKASRPWAPVLLYRPDRGS